MTNAITSLLGPGSELEGALRFEQPLRIDGRFRGRIDSRSALVLGESAEVEATIVVDTVIIRGGQLRGRVVAREAIEVYAPAIIIGQLHAPSLFLDKGVTMHGSCQMTPVSDDDLRAAHDPLPELAVAEPVQSGDSPVESGEKPTETERTP